MTDLPLADFSKGNFVAVPAFSEVQMSVMPLFHMDGTRKRGVGTCFAITNQGVCLTARHVVEHAFPAAFADSRDLQEQDGALFALYVEPPTNPDQTDLVGGFLPVKKSVVVNNLDIAAILLGLPISKATGRPIKMPANRLGLGAPVVNQNCFALGYHAMEWEGEEPLQKVTQNLAATRGTIEELHVPFRDSHSHNFPCFRTSARYDGGMSGGPVIGDDGLVRGVVCSSMKLDGEDEGHISYASLIAPAMLLLLEAANARGEIAPRFLWEFVEGGAISADLTGFHGSAAQGECRIVFSGLEMTNRVGT